MNDKIAKTMLGLCIGYLSVFYVLKFFFPELLIQAITNPSLIHFGEIISSSRAYGLIFNIIGVCITYYLFACASSGKYMFSVLQFCEFAICAILSIICYYFIPELYTHTSVACMFAVSCFAKGKLQYATIAFIIHGYLSQFLMSIRGFETVLVQFSGKMFFSIYLLSIEAYIWQILLSIIFYIKEKQNGFTLSPLYEHSQGASREGTCDCGKEGSDCEGEL